MPNANDNLRIEIYRVRKSWSDIRSQKGVYFIYENAVRVAKRTKCNVYNSAKECVWNYEEEILCSN